jgi:hypothetical protein
MVLLLAGCAESTGGRVGVEGKVTLKGVPLDTGFVMFVPEAVGGAATQASTMIANGEYRIPAPQGLFPGKYRVALSSGDGKTPASDPNAAPGPTGNFASKERIPAKYNTETTLSVEVKAGANNSFDFQVP